MRKIFTIVLIIIANIFINAQWTPVTTPFTSTSGYIPTFRVLGSKIANIDEDRKLYFSNDEGNTWKNVINPFGDQISSVLLTPNKMYIAADGINVSSDNGLTQTKVYDLAGTDWVSVGEDIYCAPFNRGIVKYNSTTNTWNNIYKNGVSFINTFIAGKYLYCSYKNSLGELLVDAVDITNNAGVTTNLPQLKYLFFNRVILSIGKYYAQYRDDLYVSNDGLTFNNMITAPNGEYFLDLAIISDTIYTAFSSNFGFKSNGIRKYNKATASWEPYDQGISYGTDTREFNFLYHSGPYLWSLNKVFFSFADVNLIKRKVGYNVATTDPLLQDKIRIYPNPTADIIHIELNDISLKPTQIEVYNSNGKLVIQNEENTDNINTQNWPKGMYLIKLNFENTYWTKKIIKN
jgi:hypothetical protein